MQRNSDRPDAPDLQIERQILPIEPGGKVDLAYSQLFSLVNSMPEILPYRYTPRDPEKIYYCHLCHGKLLPGETFTLLAVVKKGVAVEHWPSCPHRVAPAKTDKVLNIASA